MVDRDLISWLKLLHTRGIGPRTYKSLLRSFNNDPYTVLTAGVSRLIAAGFSAKIARQIHASHTCEYQADLDWLHREDHHHIITYQDPLYPSLLREIEDAPPLLYFSGDLSAIPDKPSVAIIGSRKATQTGRKVAHELACSLASCGFTITSGLAKGIDSSAHHGALSIEYGTTVAVLAHGLDTIYPRENKALARKVIKNGGLVSEFSPAVTPQANFFPRRNRIISGLSLGTIVVEAAARSGSLITCRHALDQNREVFAVPGPVYSRQSQGCHQLIQRGAKLVTNTEDVLEELNFKLDRNLASIEEQKPSASLSKTELKFLQTLEYTPMSINQIVTKSGLTPDKVSSMLITLEVSGHVICDACGQYSRSVTE